MMCAWKATVLYVLVISHSFNQAFTRLLKENGIGVCKRRVSYRSREVIESISHPKIVCCKKNEQRICVSFCKVQQQPLSYVSTKVTVPVQKYKNELFCCHGYKETDGTCEKGGAIMQFEYYIIIVSLIVFVALLITCFSVWRCHKLKLLCWEERAEKQQASIMISTTVNTGADKASSSE